MRPLSWVTLLWVGCATTPASTPVATPTEKPAPAAAPTETERACLDALQAGGARLASDEFTTCERDLDCVGVSALISGHCGTVVNARAFDTHLDTFAALTATCDPLPQVVPRCPRLRPVCRETKCTTEPVSEVPDECTELRAALVADATKANTCEEDTQCALLEERPTAAHFVSATLDRQEQLARACGTVPPERFSVSAPPTQAFCVSGRCVSEKANPQFTTVVRDRGQLVPPELDHDCIRKQFLATFTDPQKLRRRREWLLSYIASLDATGRQNQFEFLVPPNLPPEAQRAFAARLTQCRAVPAKHRGKPVAVREYFRIRWVVE